MSGARTVLVEAPARLHLGLIDLRGDVGRRFGGIGAALESPSLLLEARPAESLSAEGAEAERLLLYGRRFLEYHKIEGGAALHVRRAFPAHAGLGSGTQLALATARALATLFDRSAGVVELAKATCRGQRSAIGTYAFEQGGFVLEGGRRTSGDGPAPLLLRQAVPAAWRCLVVIPDVPRGLSGAAEEEAFRTMPPPPAELGERIAHRILMLVLPALAEADMSAFGRGITEVQALVGEMFRPVQGERFAHARVAELVKALLAAGAAGAGQSSWGPAVFGFFASEDEARRAEGRVARSGTTFVTPFNNTGARSWTA